MDKGIFLGLAMFVVAGPAMASGFRCQSENGYGVRIYNKTTLATRSPAVLVVSHEEASPSTLVKAVGAEIRKHNRLNSVQYVADTAHGEFSKVIVQIAHKEGRHTLADGATASGHLILVDSEGNREVSTLSCKRYLKE